MAGASRLLVAAGVACAALGSAGCVMPDDVAKLQKDVADLRGELRRVWDNQGQLEKDLAELRQHQTDPNDVLRREELAEMQLKVDRVERQLGMTTEHINDLGQRLDRRGLENTPRRATGTAAGPPSEEPPGDASPGASPEAQSPASGGEPFPDPEALFNTAYADFSKGNYSLAISGFEEFAQRFPESALADNARYWIAECWFSQGDYTAAVNALDELLERYPESDKAAAANLKKALAYQERNQIQQAIIQYRYVVTAFPQTDEARLARDKLSGLGASPN